MVSHLEKKVRDLVNIVNPKENEIVLDIGCNDGTMLNLYKDVGMKRIGIDPSSKKFRDNFQDDIEVIYDYFSEESVSKIIGDKKCKIITSIAMFYDINDPISFMKEISSLLAKDGIWALELSYLPLMLKNLTYDQICHEHVTYLGLKEMKWMTDRTGMKIIDVSFNYMNGGSFYLYVAKDESDYLPKYDRINEILHSEKCLSNFEYFERFNNRILSHKDEINNTLKFIKNSNKTVYGYGASTKANIILNLCEINKSQLPKICDANPEKFNLSTPGTNLPIIPKKQMREENPDYLMVFIWHFRKEILVDEYHYIMNGGQMIFVLPRIHIVNKENYERYLKNDFDELSFSL